MKSFLRWIRTLSLLLLALAPSVAADVITDWNKIASDYLIQNASSHETRGLAMVHVAQFDAVNAVVGGYTPYALNVVAPGASAEAAAVQAAYVVLTNISRSSVSVLNRALTNSLNAISDGDAKEDGRALGRLAAETIVRLRAADNMDLPISAPSSAAVGKWRTTPHSFSPGQGANRRYYTPFTMRSAAAFRPGPPPALNSELYAADLEEVRLLGASKSTNRTVSQTDAARFHYAGYKAFLDPVLAHRTLPLIETARMFALFYMISFDGELAFLEAQYVYSLWRPITAIRNADNDGNDATVTDAAWNPLLETPPHPEYPSGTCTGTSGQVTLLTSIYGDDFSFTSISGNTGAKPRTFERLSAMIDDAIEARVSAGAHYRNSCRVGVELGRKIALNAMNNFLTPLPRLSAAPGTEPGVVALHLNPGAGVRFRLESSADLIQWQPMQTNSYGITLHSESVGAAGRRFYRAMLAP